MLSPLPPPFSALFDYELHLLLVALFVVLVVLSAARFSAHRRPQLRAVQDAEDLKSGFGYAVDNNEGGGRDHQFARAADPSWPAEPG